jgi:hypothetical protein
MKFHPQTVGEVRIVQQDKVARAYVNMKWQSGESWPENKPHSMINHAYRGNQIGFRSTPLYAFRGDGKIVSGESILSVSVTCTFQHLLGLRSFQVWALMV